MFSLRTHAIIFGALFALVVGIAILGNVLEAEGVVLATPAAQRTMQIVFFSLVIALALAAVPVMVKAVIAAQIVAGNGEQPLIKFVVANQVRIIAVMWALMIAGLALAIPAAIEDGMFDQAPAAPTEAS
jgi:hypothetical protein